MKKVCLTLVLFLFSALVYARGDSGHMGDFSFGGFYGLASVSPTDINTLSTAVASTPPLGGITSDLYYGGNLEFMLSHHLNLKVAYEMHDAKNVAVTNLSSSTGFEVTENNVMGILDFYLVRNKGVYAYVGAGAGVPTYFHLSQNTSSNVQRNAQFLTCYEGDAGIGVMMGDHLSLYFEGGYQQIISGNIQDSSGNTLKLANGTAAVINLSGPRANAGLKFHF